MTAPFIPAAQPGQRNAQGYLDMPGGYADAISRFQGGAPQGFVPGAPQGMPAAQPTYQVAPSQPAPLPAWTPPNPNPMPPQGWPGQGGVPFQPQSMPVPQPQVLPGQQPQYQQQFQQQQPQPQIQPQAGADLNQRLAGPGIPVELQGRSLGELIQIHNGLRQIHLQSLSQPQNQPTYQQQTPAPAQPQVQPSTGPQSGTPAWDWRNPEPHIQRATEAVVSRLFEERLMPALAPMMQNNAVQTITNARNSAAQHIGPQRFAQLEPLIHQSLQGIDPRALMNPQTWVVAAERAAGVLALNPQMNGQVRQAPQNGGPGVYPVQQVAPGANPLPNLNTFFSEQPTQGGPGVQQTQLSDAQRYYADQMGIPYAVYAAWSGGSNQQQPAAGGWR